MGLIDFGQVKQIGPRDRAALAKVMIALDERNSEPTEAQLATISQLALDLGLVLRPNSPAEGPAATAIWLFDGSVSSLPGGFDTGELSPNSPVKVLQSFPQDLVLVGRSTVLIKGIAAKLNVSWNLASKWAPIARRVLAPTALRRSGVPRLRAILALLGRWVMAKAAATAAFVAAAAPPWLRSKLADAILRVRELWLSS